MNLDDQSMGQERKQPRYSVAARQSALTSVGDLSTIGLTLVFSIVIGTFTGKWLGSKFGNQQLGLIISFLLGTVAGFIQMYKSIYRWNRRIEQQKELGLKGKTHPD